MNTNIPALASVYADLEAVLAKLQAIDADKIIKLRSAHEKIERLRLRAKRLAQDNPSSIVASGILLGILDLLDDEL